MIMRHDNDYSVTVFFPSEKPKKWRFVHRLNYFASNLLDKKHSDWKYFNVYDRRTGKFRDRFYKGNIIPDFLPFSQ